LGARNISGKRRNFSEIAAKKKEGRTSTAGGELESLRRYWAGPLMKGEQEEETKPLRYKKKEKGRGTPITLRKGRYQTGGSEVLRGERQGFTKR